MLNKLLGIDNCIGCRELLRLFGDLRCKKYNQIIHTNYYLIPIKSDCCQKPFKYDSSHIDSADDKLVN
jgi:hypothetical protein